MIYIDRVAEQYKCDWEKAANLPVMEFLNVLSFAIAKNKYEIAQQKAAYDRIKSKNK